MNPTGEAAMRCCVNIPNLGDFADPRKAADIARLAEETGWDGLFVWDQLIDYNRDLVGEFAATNILLAAAALATDRIRLGTQVTPVPRRRPRQLAREIATLDRCAIPSARAREPPWQCRTGPSPCS
jgi:alkanesulfonate monooxygenase SsuD/methylene tetrahydromethanopterin reductase-like flavin-dependent oxidoreductase (luciferase family)